MKLKKLRRNELSFIIQVCIYFRMSIKHVHIFYSNNALFAKERHFSATEEENKEQENKFKK
jgi:hypothetical protein